MGCYPFFNVGPEEVVDVPKGAEVPFVQGRVVAKHKNKRPVW